MGCIDELVYYCNLLVTSEGKRVHYSTGHAKQAGLWDMAGDVSEAQRKEIHDG